MSTPELQRGIEAAWASRDAPLSGPARDVIATCMAQLDAGTLRVATPGAQGWTTHAWIKQAVLLYFASRAMQRIELPPFSFHDKIPLKRDLTGVRVVPPGTVRYGAYLAPGCILMPGYVNIGAYIGAGTMVDTWATVGSCAQIGRDVHIAGGAGIGGVLEPPQAAPVIVEDGAFIGSRCVVVEGVHVEAEAVLGAGVVITASTPIIDVTGAQEVVHRGRVPARAVVVPGSRPRRFASGTYELPCALIVGSRGASTDRKVSLNEALRRFEVPA